MLPYSTNREQHVTAFALVAPNGPKRHPIMWTTNVREKDFFVNNNIHNEGKKKSLPNYKTIRGKDCDICGQKPVILIRHYWVKNLRPLLNTDGMARYDQLVTCRVDRIDRRVGRKLVENNNDRMDEMQWSNNGGLFISLIHSIVEILLN